MSESQARHSSHYLNLHTGETGGGGCCQLDGYEEREKEMERGQTGVEVERVWTDR